jgi:hypothetical protein
MEQYFAEREFTHFSELDLNNDVEGNACLLQFGSSAITFELECKRHCDEYIQQYFAGQEFTHFSKLDVNCNVEGNALLLQLVSSATILELECKRYSFL